MVLGEQHINELNETFRLVSDYDFSDYSEKSLLRRIEKILSDESMSFQELILKLKTDRVFLEHVVKEITVNTTELFRDPKIWHIIKYQILKKLQEKETLNIWHVGCSSGQEVYSMNILLHEAGLADRTKLYGTDINGDMLARAQEGRYPFRFNLEYLDNFKQVVQINPLNYEDFNDVPFSKYFEIDELNDTIKVREILKSNVEFKKHNLVNQDNLFKIKFDMILCRNVLIYFNVRLQNKLFHTFSDNLLRKGYLILGAHESILGPEVFGLIKHGNYYIKK